MEVSTEYRARPLHLSTQGSPPPQPRQPTQNQQLTNHSHPHPQPHSNRPIPLSPNTLLSFQNPEDIDQAAVHRIAPDSVYSPGYADGQAIFDLYTNSPTASTFPHQQHASASGSGVGRQPSIKLHGPEEGAAGEAYGGMEEPVAVAEAERGSWNPGHSGENGEGGSGQPRGSTMSAMTMESEMDPFAFSVSWAVRHTKARWRSHD